MTHTGNTGNAEIQGKYVEDCFASAGHDTGSTADIRVRTCSFHNILNDEKRTASGNSAKDNERKQFKLYPLSRTFLKMGMPIFWTRPLNAILHQFGGLHKLWDAPYFDYFFLSIYLFSLFLM